MLVKIIPSWDEHLEEEYEKDYFKKLVDFVGMSYNAHTCYPPKEAVFNALNSCDFNDVKVVILGQDPYHGPKQANGLAFSVNDELAHPPSLVNIFKELKTDLDIDIPTSGNLQRWANQGVLLLNATLTVQAHTAGSHQKQGWEQFTDVVIDTLSRKHNNLVFLLWGGYAKKKGRKIDIQKHLVLTSGHPSPLSANRGYWFGNRHFSKTNEYLKSKGKKSINW